LVYYAKSLVAEFSLRTNSFSFRDVLRFLRNPLIHCLVHKDQALKISRSTYISVPHCHWSNNDIFWEANSLFRTNGYWTSPPFPIPLPPPPLHLPKLRNLKIYGCVNSLLESKSYVASFKCPYATNVCYKYLPCLMRLHYCLYCIHVYVRINVSRLSLLARIDGMLVSLP